MPSLANQFLMSIETDTRNSSVRWGNFQGYGINLSSNAGGILVCNAFRVDANFFVYGIFTEGATPTDISAARADSVNVKSGTGGRFSLYYR